MCSHAPIVTSSWQSHTVFICVHFCITFVHDRAVGCERERFRAERAGQERCRAERAVQERCRAERAGRERCRAERAGREMCWDVVWWMIGLKVAV